MTLHPLRLRSHAGFWIPTFLIVLGPIACGNSGSPNPDGSSPSDGSTDGTVAATCGADIPAGQACTNAPDNAPVIMPTWVTGTMPSGTGGTIVAGTYHLSAQTYYNTVCPSTPLSGTLMIGGGCFELSTDTPIVATGSSRLTVHGNIIEISFLCANTGPFMGTADAPNRTFTATPSTLALFTMNAQAGNSNPDRVEVYTLQ